MSVCYHSSARFYAENKVDGTIDNIYYGVYIIYDGTYNGDPGN